MSIPLDKLIDKDCNVYEMTCVAIKEATLLSERAGNTETEGDGEKVVSVALDKVLNDEVEYTSSDEEQ
ncbi:MAG: DNA-directed RNA polymerase subunit omega [Spirochaetales bacterium]|nr:DNA-directed RNA polymerase subunit omega [Spirochaetales bacterium]